VAEAEAPHKAVAGAVTPRRPADLATGTYIMSILRDVLRQRVANFPGALIHLRERILHVVSVAPIQRRNSAVISATC